MKYVFSVLFSTLILSGFTQQVRHDVLQSVTKTTGGTSSKSLEAKFTANVTQGKAPLTVQFTDQSTGSPTSWKWFFGDGDSSLVQNPSHIYLNPGVFTVKLIISDGASGFALEKKDYIQVNYNYLSCDTLHSPLPEPLTYYIITNNGYVTGNNIYGDKALCDYFDNIQPNLAVTGLICDFSIAKQVTGRNEKLNIHIWKPTLGIVKPGIILATDTLLLSKAVNDVANYKVTTIDFKNAVQPGGSFFMGITLPKMIGDTLCLWSTKNGKVTVNTTWIQQSNNEWVTAQSIYSPQTGPAFMISCAIYPKVCLLNAIDHSQTVLPFAIWPNPASDLITIVKQEDSDKNTRYSIVNIAGTELLSGNLAESVSTAVDVSSLKPGIYLVRISGKKSAYSAKIVIK